jgi:ADP-dependent NAD(P)H-hydrate dehydratase / NAD(P)H-hydrate epimerase
MIELLTNAEMTEADRLAIASGIRGIDLMENAGRAVAEAVLTCQPRPARVVVIAGPGNNGGDGFVAARLLAQQGLDIRVLLLGDREKLKGDAAAAAARWTGSTAPASADALRPDEVVIDALFGAGLERAVDGPARAMIEAMNGASAPIVAVDLPSGINGTSGAVLGAAVNATQTVTFFRRKTGHVLLPGRLHCGPVQIADIGIPANVLDTIRPRTFVNCPALWHKVFPIPRAEGHKYSRGHAVIVSGELHRTGAARLAARGALRSGAGLVTIASPRAALAVNAAASLAIMVQPVDGAMELSHLLTDRRINAILLGPGGGVGAAMRDMVRAALSGSRGVVLDADALTSFADDPESLSTELRKRMKQPTILTPHGGEFARLFSVLPGISNSTQKLEATRHASHETAAVVVLKGADTIVATPDGRAAIAENAPPWLATAGTGDVLAGSAAALLAQGMPAFEAACAAVWLHGEAGNAVGPGLIAEDLPEAMPVIYRRLFAELKAS